MAEAPQPAQEQPLRVALIASGPLPSLYQLCLRASCQRWLSPEHPHRAPAFVLEAMNEAEVTQVIDALRFERKVQPTTETQS